jgi:hypothetical protein
MPPSCAFTLSVLVEAYNALRSQTDVRGRAWHDGDVEAFGEPGTVHPHG